MERPSSTAAESNKTSAASNPKIGCRLQRSLDEICARIRASVTLPVTLLDLFPGTARTRVISTRRSQLGKRLAQHLSHVTHERLRNVDCDWGPAEMDRRVDFVEDIGVVGVDLNEVRLRVC